MVTFGAGFLGGLIFACVVARLSAWIDAAFPDAFPPA